MKKIFTLLLFFPLLVFAQSELNENFNRMTIDEFPPYGWLNLDKTGVAGGWTISPDGAKDVEGNATNSASSYIPYTGGENADNWLITPPLWYEPGAKLEYWVGSFWGEPQHLEVWMSSIGTDYSDFRIKVDDVIFTGDPNIDFMERIIELDNFDLPPTGGRIYIAFRHIYTENAGTGIHLDNVHGPKVIPFDYDLGINEIKGLINPTCDLEDTKLTVTVENLGTREMNGFKIYYQSAYLADHDDEEEEEENYVYSTLFSDEITQTINAGASLELTLTNELPFSEYGMGHIEVRVYLENVWDEYAVNDTVIISFNNQTSLEIPVYVGFENSPQEDAFDGWYFSNTQVFNVGSNTLFVNRGNGYLTAGVYAPLWEDEKEPETGLEHYVGTRCISLDADEEYRVDFSFAFRKFLAGVEDKEINFRIIAGHEQRNLLEDPIVLIDTKLSSSRPLVANQVKASYDLFSSDAFSVPESGTYFIGLQFYSDEPVENYEQEWMVFIDDFYLLEADADYPVDLRLDAINTSYGCNLGEEPISFEITNASLVEVTNITVSYTINNGTPVTETIERIAANSYIIHTFSQKADFSSYGAHRIDGEVIYSNDVYTDNNEMTISTENLEPRDLPFRDSFEEYDGELYKLEDVYYIIRSGFYSWEVVKYEDDAYTGSNFLIDAFIPESNVPQDDWIISCCFNFEKGVLYDVSFMYRIDMPNVIPGELGIYILSDYDNTAIVEKLGELEIKENTYQKFSAKFFTEQDRVGHLALHSFSAHAGGDGAIIMIDDLVIEGPESVGIEDRDANNSIIIYPNPATDYVYISSEKEIKSVEIYNAVGVKMMNIKGESNQIQIPVNNIENGYYILTVTTVDGAVVTSKLNIQ